MRKERNLDVRDLLGLRLEHRGCMADREMGVGSDNGRKALEGIF